MGMANSRTSSGGDTFWSKRREGQQNSFDRRQRPRDADPNQAEGYARAAMRCLTSHQQNDQDDQQDGTETAADIRAPVVEAAATKQDQKDNDKHYKVHEVAPMGNHCDVEATAGYRASGTLPVTAD
jgi:hypothetical protein